MKELTSCGCCDGVSQDTPVKVFNRPGLSAVKYRIGEHHKFKSSLISKLSKKDLTGLKKLTSRADNDFTIALLDAFATVADVLTFYQERIANESYLKTATEQISIVELSRLIGYELNPGVAANTYLSFTLDDKTLQEGQEIVRGIKSGGNEMPIVKIVKGTKAQSIPEQDEDPQFFETIEDVNGKSDWNAMELRTFMTQESISGKNEIFIEGLDNNLKEGDHLVIDEDGVKVKKKIFAIEYLRDLEITKIILQIEPLIFIYTVPAFYYYQPTNYYIEKKPFGPETVNDWIKVDKNNPKSIPVSQIQSIAQIQHWNNHEFRSAINNSVKKIQDQSLPELYVFRKSASLFGYNAPTKITVKNNVTVVVDNLAVKEDTNEIMLDSEYPEVKGGQNSFVAVQTSNYGSSKIYDVSRSDLLPASKYGLSGKSTKLTLNGNTKNWWTGTKLKDIRSTTVHVQNEKIALSRVPILNPLEKDTSEFFLSKFYIDLFIGQKIIISGELKDIPSVIRSEVHVIKETYLQEGLTRLVLERPLENTFVRKTVRVNANVALASHGETVNEVLGSGSAGETFQKFTLKHTPLTYTSSNSASGIATTLEVRINDILWKEVSSLYGKQPEDHVYVTRQNSDAQTTIIFGDGITGARLPTGNQNIRAIYRKGIGQSGMLKSNQLSQLASQPLHLKTVNNPLAPEGAQDGEQMTDARANANLTMYTLDRIVSLQDYEDFTRAFAGITKSKAIWTWTGNGKAVHITIAGVNGEEVKPDSTLYQNLLAALKQSAFPGTLIHIDSYLRRYFTISGNLLVDTNYRFEIVHAEVISHLQHEFSFSQRKLGQDVTLSEVITAIQSIEGVIAIDIDSLHFIESNIGLEQRLVSNLALSGTEQPSPAELVVLQQVPFEFKQKL